ncbi:hypothetical protein [Clostridium botulinum]|nr:hypothetical protein [Clostridium botulinum]
MKNQKKLIIKQIMIECMKKKPDWDLDKNYEKRQQMILDSVRAVK